MGPFLARSQDIRSGIFKVADAAHISEETYIERVKRAVPQYGDLLYSREGTYFGIAAEVPKSIRVCLGQRMVLIRPDSRVVNSRYLRFWLNSPVVSAHVQGFRDGSVAERLNLPTIRALPVLLPPRSKQDAIAHILGTLDDKIELNRRMNETLEGLARAIFKSWFVDFDPVRRNMARNHGRGEASPANPGEQRPQGDASPLQRGLHTPNSLADIDALFPDSFEDSELGKIPRGWKISPLSEAFVVNPPRPLPSGTLAPYLDMQNAPTHGHRAISWVDRPLGSGTRFANGDTLLARITPCLENGKTVFVDFLPSGQIGWGSTEFIVLRPKSPLPDEYGYFVARSEALRAHAISNMTGSSGRQRVPVSCFDQFYVVLPPMSIAESFGKWAHSVFSLIRTRDEESRTLTNIRDTLLPKLLSGELRNYAIVGN
jgi:type I restriction enzyme S subunit